jgi:hypothetical protein
MLEHRGIPAFPFPGIVMMAHSLLLPYADIRYLA